MLLRNYYKACAYTNFGSNIADLKPLALDGNVSAFSYLRDDFASPSAQYPYMGRVNVGSLNYNNTGIILGSGTTPATLDDYRLENRIVAANLTTSVDLTKSADENGAYISALITITNTTDEAVTVAECGLHTGGASGSTGSAEKNFYLLDRTVLETPITIEPDGVGQITYTIRMNYPAA